MGRQLTRVAVDVRPRRVFLWTADGASYRMYIVNVTGRLIRARKLLHFTDLEDSRVNQDARDHWNRLLAMDGLPEVPPSVLGEYLCNVFAEAKREVSMYGALVNTPRLCSVKLHGYILDVDLTK